MASGLLATYLGEGLAASRPAAPDTGSAIAFWWSTDTNELAAWVENAWLENIIPSAGAATTTAQLTGTATTSFATPDSVAALWEQGADVASAATVSLGEGGYFNITGTTTITDIDFATDKAGRMAWVKFAGALTLTHNASTLILPTGANITTVAGDTACFISEGADAVRCVAYQRASDASLRTGTAFPGSPAAGDLFWRSDRNLEYFYDGTRWLSTQIITLPMVIDSGLFPQTATGTYALRMANPWAGKYDVYVEEIDYYYFLNAAGNWTITFRTVAAGAGTTLLGSATVSTASSHANGRITVGAVVANSTENIFRADLTENSGTAGIYLSAVVIYRLVG